MLIFALNLTETGAEALDWTDVKSSKMEPGMRRWLHFDRRMPDARLWLVSSGNLPKFACDVLYQEESRPRAFLHEGAIMMNLRGVNFNEGEQPYDLLSLRLYANESLIVTTRTHRVFTVDELKNRLLENEGGMSNGEIVARLASRLTERIESVSQRLEEDVDELEEDMLDQNTPPPKQAVANFRRAILSMRRYIFPQREAISNLIREGEFLFSEKDILHLRETQDVIMRLSEQMDIIRERALVLQEQIAELRAEAMNQRLFVLAIISAIFLPLGFVTGLFGVNVGGMPGVSSAIAFAVLCAGCVGLTLGLLVLFRYLKWL